MRKLKTIAAAAAVAVATLFAGCGTNETLLITAANAAGNIGISAWLAIDAPDDEVKDALKDVVSLIEAASSKIGDGDTYMETLSPVMQEAVARKDKLTSAQKNLINAGACILLSGLDAFIEANPGAKSNAGMMSRVAASFCRGCVMALSRDDASAAAKSIRRAREARSMQYDAKAKAFILR